jgi:hypothetical protein
MTLLGKILVCVNLVFSLMLASVAFGIYTQRINWTDTPREATPEKAAGELALRKARIDQAWKSLQLAEARQQTALGDLRLVEVLRPADQKWYASQLEQMQTLPADKGAIKVAVIQDGRLVPDDKNFGRPALRDGLDRFKRPLLSLDAYNRRIKETFDQVAKRREELNKLSEEDTALTQRVIGPKGLRQRLADEEDKRQRVETEIDDFVEPRLLTVEVESASLLRRRQELLKRIEELKRTASSTAER